MGVIEEVRWQEREHVEKKGGADERVSKMRETLTWPKCAEKLAY